MAVIGFCDLLACTSAIVGSGRSSTGNALLWKHRDTGAPHNFIAHHEATDSTLEYIALHNNDDTEGNEAWIGMNRAGLAIMNTASYNLAPDTASIKDQEGIIITLALQKCHTVDDFALLLDTLPRPLGVQANFGVIDATGEQAFFETFDNSYTRFDINDTDAVIRTNYSHSGGKGNRLGVARERTAKRFISGIRYISPAEFTDSLSKRYIDPLTGRDMVADGRKELIDNGDYIPRYISTASIVIEAIPSEQSDGSNYVMWTRLGFPPCADKYTVTFTNIPKEVMRSPDGITEAERIADNRKKQFYDGRRAGKHRIITLP